MKIVMVEQYHEYCDEQIRLYEIVYTRDEIIKLISYTSAYTKNHALFYSGEWTIEEFGLEWDLSLDVLLEYDTSDKFTIDYLSKQIRYIEVCENDE